MSGSMWGADVEALEDLGRLFRARGEQVSAIHAQVTTLVAQYPWEGQDAESFAQDWAGPHRARVNAAALAFAALGDELINQAAEQRRASGDNESSSSVALGGSGAPADGEGGDELDTLAHLLTGLGLAQGIVDELIKAAEAGEIPTSVLLGLLDNKGLVKAIEVAGPLLTGAGFILDLAEGFSAHPDLPLDERAFYAVTVASIGLGVSVGTEAIGMVIGGFVGSIIPVAGTTAGIVVGKIVGQVTGVALEAAYDYADDRLDITATVADAALDSYQYAKSHDFNPVSMGLDIGGEVVDDVIAGAESLVDSGLDLVESWTPW